MSAEPRDDGGPVHPGTDARKLKAALEALMDAVRADDEAGTLAVMGQLTDAHRPGISLRDYLAGQALAGHCASNFLAPAMTNDEADLLFLNAAAFAYRCADAMIAERKK